jgi:Ca2+-transporting ATPase
MSAGEMAEALGTDLAAGLSHAEAKARLARHGRNVLPEGRRRTVLHMFLDQFRDFLIWILIAATAVSFALGEMTDAYVILAILVMNAALGVAQEYKASRALEALKQLSVPECEVVRDGHSLRISSETVVPGDLVVLREGSHVPADLRLVETHHLRTDEASLTGESAPVEKTAEPTAHDVPLAERRNMAYAGTVVVYGRGAGLAVATGAEREIGRIAQLLETETRTSTPLQQKLAGFGKGLGLATLAICAVIFGLGLARGEPPLGIFMTAVSLAVAAIPEGLPAIITVALAVGVHRMSRHHAIVRRLHAVETLGCTTTICTDKTGTLTESRMSVADVVPAPELVGSEGAPDAAVRRRILQIAVLCNDADAGADETGRVGDPTELALLDFARKSGVSAPDLRRAYRRLAEVPFDSDRKCMATLHDLDEGRRLLVKGAPDVLLERCAFLDSGARPQPLGDADRDRIRGRLDDMAGRALRVLAFAWKDAAGAETASAEDEIDLVMAGLVAMRDPPRPEVRAALDQATGAGIRTIMITGDALPTAKAIAAELGLLEPGDECVTGRDLEAWSPDHLRGHIGRTRVFARVWPEQKLRIVEALQSSGEIVAMTGDGVNDAPALQRADIGVAMGVTGTDVAKGAADLVLMDDNFATIVEAIREGRVIFDNIRKFVTYLLACNLGELLAILVPVAIGLGVPLVPVQILLINLVTDGLPAMALGMDAPGPDIMRRRPRPPKEGILTRHLCAMIGFNAVFIALAVILAFWLGTRSGDAAAGRTMAFVTLALAELARAWSARSETQNVWRLDPRTNLYLAGACLLSAAIVLAAVVMGPLRTLFGTCTLDGGQWATVLALSLVPLAAYEAWKAGWRLTRKQR